MHFNFCVVFYSLNSHQHVSAVIAAIFSVMLLLQEYKCINFVSCAAITTYQLKIILISVIILFVYKCK